MRDFEASTPSNVVEYEKELPGLPGIILKDANSIQIEGRVIQMKDMRSMHIAMVEYYVKQPLPISLLNGDYETHTFNGKSNLQLQIPCAIYLEALGYNLKIKEKIDERNKDMLSKEYPEGYELFLLTKVNGAHVAYTREKGDSKEIKSSMWTLWYDGILRTQEEYSPVRAPIEHKPDSIDMPL